MWAPALVGTPPCRPADTTPGGGRPNRNRGAACSAQGLVVSRSRKVRVTPPLRPSARALAAFGVRGRGARPLAGGQGRAWSVGDVVLKPVDDVGEAVWAAGVLSVLVEDGFRISRPVRS